MNSIKPDSFWSRKSIDLASAEPSCVLQSKAMPGFSLKVWRTDGHTGPLPQVDVKFMMEQSWDKHRVTHLRNDWHVPPTSYDLVVETLPPVPEMPEDVEDVPLI